MQEQAQSANAVATGDFSTFGIKHEGGGFRHSLGNTQPCASHASPPFSGISFNERLLYLM